jgi:hypothetical protein
LVCLDTASDLPSGTPTSAYHQVRFNISDNKYSIQAILPVNAWIEKKPPDSDDDTASPEVGNLSSRGTDSIEPGNFT